MKRILSILMVLAMLLTFAFAEEGAVAIPEAKEGETVVEFWCGIWETWNQNWIQAMVDKFNAAEDRPFYVKLVWTDTGVMGEKLAAARAADIAPDVYTNSFGAIANDYQNGYILDLKNLLPQACWDDLLPSALELITVGDAYVAYPWMMEPSIVMYYDKDAFTEVGLDPECPPTTWEELIEYAKLLTNEDRFGVDIDLSYNFWGWTYTCNDHQYMITDDWSAANINSQGMRDLFDFYRGLRSGEYCSQTALKGQNSGAYAVLEGRSAMSFSGSWGVAAIDNNYPEKRYSIGVAAAPTKDGSPMCATTGGWTFAIDAHAHHVDEAAKWIEFCMADVADPSKVADFFVAASFSKYTTRASVGEYLVANTAAATDERMQTIQADIMPYVVAEPIYPGQIVSYVNNALTEVALNGADIDEAIATAEAEINQYIADYELAGKNPKAAK